MDQSISLVTGSSACCSLHPSSESAKALPSQTNSNSPIQLRASLTSTISTPSSTTTTSTAFPHYQSPHAERKSFNGPINAAVTHKVAIVWFRNDLRIHDNEALLTANRESLAVLPVYCFDPRHFGNAPAECDKTAPYRAKFLLECVSNLRDNLRERGSDLIVRLGKPEEVLVSLAKAVGADGLYVHQEVSGDEIECETKVSVALQEEGVDIKYFWGSTLLHTDDLPFKLEDMPYTYNGFLESVQHINARKILEAPKWLTGLPLQGRVIPGDIPTPQELGFGHVRALFQEFPRLGVRTKEKRGETEQKWILDLFFRLNRRGIRKHNEGLKLVVSSLIGGEVEALQRLKIFSGDHMKQWSNKFENADCGDIMYASNFCSQISPWLAMGCLSPRQMYKDLNTNAKRAVSASPGSLSNDNEQNCLIFELLWRDFFRFISKKFVVCKWDSEVLPATACTTAAPV